MTKFSKFFIFFEKFKIKYCRKVTFKDPICRLCFSAVTILDAWTLKVGVQPPHFSELEQKSGLGRAEIQKWV